MVAPRVFLAVLCVSATFLLSSGAAAVEIDATGGLINEIEVTAEGSYDFSLTSDGGTRLLIDGAEVIADGSYTGSAWLIPGIHSLEVQVDACCGLVQLFLPNEYVSIQTVQVPEASTLLLLGAGLAVLAIAVRMRDRWNPEHSR